MDASMIGKAVKSIAHHCVDVASGFNQMIELFSEENGGNVWRHLGKISEKIAKDMDEGAEWYRKILPKIEPDKNCIIFNLCIEEGSNGNEMIMKMMPVVNYDVLSEEQDALDYDFLYREPDWHSDILDEIFNAFSATNEALTRKKLMLMALGYAIMAIAYFAQDKSANNLYAGLRPPLYLVILFNDIMYLVGGIRKGVFIPRDPNAKQSEYVL